MRNGGDVSAYEGQTSLAPAGTYGVRLKVRDEKLTGSFKIETFPPPR